MTCECTFEGKIPTHCIKEVIQLIRTGGAVSDVLIHSGCATGQTGEMLKGFKNPFAGAENDPELPDTIEGCLEILEAPRADDDSFGGIVSSLVLQRLINLLLEEVSKYVKEYFNG